MIKPFEIFVAHNQTTYSRVIQIPMEWDEDVQEWLMSEEGLRQVGEEREKFRGLLNVSVELMDEFSVSYNKLAK